MLTVYHFRGHDSLSLLAVFNGIVLWGATDQTGTGYRVPLAFESDIRSGCVDLTIVILLSYFSHKKVEIIHNPIIFHVSKEDS